MRMMLANLDLYQDYAAKSPNLIDPSPEAFQDRRASIGEFMLVGSDAVIPVAGPLSYKYDFWTWLMDGCAYQVLSMQLAAAAQDADVERIVLAVDTPGGEVTGLPELAKQIAAISKPVVAVVDPCCASAGLWIASQADRIVMIESGEIGSLGVQIMAVSLAEMYEKAGIDIKLIRAKISPDKNTGAYMEKLDEKAVDYFQTRVDYWGEMFLADVANGRNVSTDVALNKFGQGAMLHGKKAVEVGLADEIGTLHSVLAESSKSKRPRSFAAENVTRFRI